MSDVVPAAVPFPDRPGDGSPVHYAFLDGLRGVMAVNVLLYHVLGVSELDTSLPGWVRRGQAVFAFGHFAVSVFIVLSGFSLMLPVARSPDRRVRGGAKAYFWRRSLRILPAYYAAVALSVAAVLLSEPYATGGGGTGPDAAVGTRSLVTHLLLVHNFSAVYSQTINRSHWSVALEWQIYFLFVFLLLPTWRRAGVLAAVAVAFAVPAAVMGLLPPGYNLDWGNPWYVGLFAVGMAAATVDVRRITPPRRAALAGATVVAAVAFLVAHRLGARPGVIRPWVSFGTDVIAGGGIAAFILYCVSSAADGGPGGWPGRLLGSGPLVFLGAMSYSLYLVHCAVLDLSLGHVHRAGYSPLASLGFRAAVTVPLSLLLAYGWSVVFERPFTARRRPAARRPPAAANPAPVPVN